MRERRVWAVGTTVLVIVAMALTFSSTTSSRVQYEVWAIDQSDSPGKYHGGTLYVWDGNELEKERGVRDQEAQGEGEGFHPLRWIRQPKSERIDLGGDMTTLCLARTGAAPVRTSMPRPFG